MLNDLNFTDPLSRMDRKLNKIGNVGGDSLRPEYRRPLPASDFAAVKQQLLDYGGTGLRGIFSTMSAPGDYIRGALAGEAGTRADGRQLMDKWHVTDKNDKG